MYRCMYRCISTLIQVIYLAFILVNIQSFNFIIFICYTTFKLLKKYYNTLCVMYDMHLKYMTETFKTFLKKKVAFDIELFNIFESIGF